MPNFCLCKVINDRSYDLQDPTVHVIHSSMADLQLLMPTDYTVSILTVIKAF